MQEFHTRRECAYYGQDSIHLHSMLFYTSSSSPVKNRQAASYYSFLSYINTKVKEEDLSSWPVVIVMARRELQLCSPQGQSLAFTHKQHKSSKYTGRCFI